MSNNDIHHDYLLVNATFGQNLQRIRRSKAWSIAKLSHELSERAQVAFTNYELLAYESGTRVPYIKRFMVLVRVLGCTADELLGIKQPEMKLLPAPDKAEVPVNEAEVTIPQFYYDYLLLSEGSRQVVLTLLDAMTANEKERKC